MPAPVTRLPPPKSSLRVAPQKQTRPLMSQISPRFPTVGLHWSPAEQGATPPSSGARFTMRSAICLRLGLPLAEIVSKYGFILPTDCAFVPKNSPIGTQHRGLSQLASYLCPSLPMSCLKSEGRGQTVHHVLPSSREELLNQSTLQSSGPLPRGNGQSITGTERVCGRKVAWLRLCFRR